MLCIFPTPHEPSTLHHSPINVQPSPEFFRLFSLLHSFIKPPIAINTYVIQMLYYYK